MREKTGERMSESKRSAAAAEVADVESEERAKTMRQTSLAKCPILKIQADNSVSDFFDGTATPHSRADSFLFRKMIEDIQAAGPGLVPLDHRYASAILNIVHVQVAYIINDDFFTCVQAAPVRHQTRPLKTRAQVKAEGPRGGGGGGGGGAMEDRGD